MKQHSSLSRSCQILGILVLPVLLAGPTPAQEHPVVARGPASGKTEQLGSIDSISLLNGGLRLSIPVGIRYAAGGDLQWGLGIYYSSKIWDFEERTVSGTTETVSVPARYQRGGLGWTFSLGRLLAPGDPSNESEDWVYLSPTGGRQTFYSTLHPGDTEIADVYYTRSSSYLRLIDAGNELTLELPDGLIHVFDATGKLKSIEDRFGNALTVTHGTNQWTLTDETDRSATVDFVLRNQDGEQVPLVSKITLPAFGGNSAVYDFQYSATTIPPAEADPRHDDGVLLTVQLLTRMTLPDGTDYEMSYHSDGELAAITLPTLGGLEFDYDSYRFPSEDCGSAATAHWSSLSRGVKERREVNGAGATLGRWTYSRVFIDSTGAEVEACDPAASEPPEAARTTVLTPAGDKAEHYFSVWPTVVPESPSGFLAQEYGLPIHRGRPDATDTRFLSSEIYEPNNEGGFDLKRSIYVDYDYERPCVVSSGGSSSQPSWGPCSEANRRLRTERTVFEDDRDSNGVARYRDITFSDFDGLGHYREMEVNGNFGQRRSYFRNFNPGYDLDLTANHEVSGSFSNWPKATPWILRTYTEETVTQGSATEKKEFCFDATTGFLLRTRELAGSVRGAHDVLSRRTADNDGNLKIAESFGGDVQTVGTGNLCAVNVPAASNYRVDRTYSRGSLAKEQVSNADGTSFGVLTYDSTIDASTGLPSVMRDQSGVATALLYDTSGRLTKVTPAEGAYTEIDYFPAGASKAKSRLRQYREDTTTVLTQEDLLFDDLGRVSREGRWLPDTDWAYRDTDYDSSGRVKKVSTWYDATDVSQGTMSKTFLEYANYDAFGRPRKLIPPDSFDDGIINRETRMVYTGDRVVRRTVSIASGVSAGGGVSEAAVQTSIQRYDVHGRLVELVEPSGPSGASVTTTFVYDVGNRLSRVSSDAIAPSLRRTFNYDGRGFLLSESHPEKTGNVTYANYDSQGRARKRTDVATVVSFEFDRAGRLTKVKEGDGMSRTLKAFTYATTNGAGNWTKNKLEVATRYNYFDVEDTLPDPTHVFEDGFECGDLSAWSSAEGAGGSGGAVGTPSCGTGIPSTVKVTETYAYRGPLGRVSKRTTDLEIDGVSSSFAQEWSYISLGHVQDVTYPTCDFVACTDDGAGTSRVVRNFYTRGWLTGVGDYVSTVNYQPNGVPRRIYHTNGLRDVYEPDPYGLSRPRSIEVKDDVATYFKSGIYQYDGAGNIKKIGSGYYLYDGVNRLTEASVAPDRMGATSGTKQTYFYDAFDNLTRIGGLHARNIPVDSATNRLSGSVTYTGTGALTGWNGNEFEYDDLQTMTRKITSNQDWLYAYTADDERILMHPLHKGDARRITLRDLDGRLLRTYLAQGAVWSIERDYIYRGGRLAAAETPAGVRHLHLDHLGSPRYVTNGTGNEVAFHAYLPYGEELTSPFQDSERMKFTGHERDLADPSSTADDFDYMHARHYAPALGRFFSFDPVATGDSLRGSHYSYVGGRAVNRFDPWGLEPVATFHDRIDVVGSGGGGGGMPLGYLDFLLYAYEERHPFVRLASGMHPNPDAAEIPDADSLPRGGCEAAPAAPPGVDIEENLRRIEDGGLSVIDVLRLARNDWNFKDPKRYGPSYGDFTNFHYGATASAAGMWYPAVARSGGAVNVLERAEVGNFSGALRAAMGALGFGEAAAFRGDEDLNDFYTVIDGALWYKNCR